ncbi:unnamed protein product, partial [Echinostoma caproni]|uniref:imidazolonepropionase n=1 Tax=Echinostoma caproni TaxID=27848 RepID=A0A183BDB3_9TREM
PNLVTSIDCKGGCVIPGFVDAHTHPAWAGDRLHEFTLKVSTSCFLIGVKAKRSTVWLTKRQDKGTTTLECKTGYGLHWPAEEKLLRVLNRAKAELPVDVSITFLSAHSGNGLESIHGMHPHRTDPKVKTIDGKRGSSCVFDLDQSMRILEAGKSIGLNINFHADELSPLGGAEVSQHIKEQHFDDPYNVYCFASIKYGSLIRPGSILVCSTSS